jgi:hypothetical protein
MIMDTPFAQLLGGYFHQDWCLDDATYEDAIRRYVRETSLENVRQALSEIDDLLAQELSEDALELLLTERGCAFSPPAAGMAWREWLEAIRTVIEAALAKGS